MKILDSRDLQKRLEELEAFRDALTGARKEWGDTGFIDPAPRVEIERVKEALERAEQDFSEDEQNELEELESLRDEVGGEWRHGVQFIPCDDFEEYARELAEDIGAVSREDSWPKNCIDWTRAAELLAQDYSSVTFRGENYHYRA